MDFVKINMKLYILNSTDPYRNLAIEEYLFLHEQDDVFMLWQNEPCVVIGKNQNAYVEVDLDYLRQNGIHLVRRITGGGAVYHDLGNVNYTFISATGEQGIDFAAFTAPVIAALATLGVRATLSGRNDLLVGGRKFSGNAQHSANGRTLHHGTLLFDSDLDVLSSALRPDEQKLRSKAVASARSRVTNLAPLLAERATTGEFIGKIASFVREKYHPEEAVAPTGAEIEALRERNASRAWLFPDRDLLASYTVTVRQRYPFGSVEISRNMHNDRITAICVRGDFFGVRPIEELEQLLTGADMGDLGALLDAVSVGEYVNGMEKQQLIELLQQI